jgi:hypothetical protein
VIVCRGHLHTDVVSSIRVYDFAIRNDDFHVYSKMKERERRMRYDKLFEGTDLAHRRLSLSASDCSVTHNLVGRLS